MCALRSAGKKQADLVDILRVNTPQAANKKVRESRWTAEDLIKVAEFTGGKIIFQMPDGEQIELK
jgi:hypothetical protein